MSVHHDPPRPSAEEKPPGHLTFTDTPDQDHDTKSKDSGPSHDPSELPRPSHHLPRKSHHAGLDKPHHRGVSVAKSRYDFFPHDTRSTMSRMSHRPSRPSMFTSRDSSIASSRSTLDAVDSNTSFMNRGTISRVGIQSLRPSETLVGHLEEPHPLHPHGQLHQHHHHHEHHGIPPLALALEEIPDRTTEMVRETFDTYREAKRRIKELQMTNIKNDQIILFFTETKDIQGRVWNTDCIIAERAISFFVKKLEAGGHLLKIYVGNRDEWMNPSNPWRKDPKFKVASLPTLLVCDTMKRLNGKRIFDMESIIMLLQD